MVKKSDFYIDISFSERNIGLLTKVVTNENWFMISNVKGAKDACVELYAFYKDKFPLFPVKYTKAVDEYNRNHSTITTLRSSIKKHRLENLTSKWPLSYGPRYITYRNQLCSNLVEY